MSKALETKKKIMALLQQKEMTISELSRQLHLSTATVSQHMEELQKMGAVEKIDNEHFKKLKYYRPIPVANLSTLSIAKYVVSLLVIVAALSGGYFLLSNRAPVALPGLNVSSVHNSSTQNTTPVSNSTNTTTAPPIASTYACPMMTYHLNGTITSYNGFTLYSANSSNSKIDDYLLKNGSTGSFNVSENVSALSEPPSSYSSFDANRTHYAYLQNINTSVIEQPSGINMTVSPQTYNVINNETLRMVVTVTTNQSATGTYLVRIDSPCYGGVPSFLITVGSKPFTGNYTPGSQIYA